MMMDIFNQLGGLDGMQQQVGQQLGTDPAQTGAALEAAVPLLLGALTRNAQTPEGAAALDSALDDHSGDALGLFQQGQMPDLQQGEKILGHVFGNQQGSAVNAVAQRAGISPQLAMQILMMAAPLVLSYLSRQRGQQGGGIGGILGSILGGLGGAGMGGGMGNSGGLGGGLGGVLGSVLGGNLGGAIGGMLGGQQASAGQQMSTSGLGDSMGNSNLGGEVLPGYPADNGTNGTMSSNQNTASNGGLLGTLNNVLEGGQSGNDNALDDLIGMFGGRRS